MEKQYLVIGASGHLGNALVSELLASGARVRALALPGEEAWIPRGAEIITGDITRPDTLKPLFAVEDPEHTVLVHAAAIITIASKFNPAVWNVNVTGTANVLKQAYRSGIGRMIYVSSVHAIPDRPQTETMVEVDHFDPDQVDGQYAKSKAAAAQLALDYAARGLNVSVVHPSGIIGPGDRRQNNYMIRTIHLMAEGKIPLSVPGGYDFVDVRDVAEGIVQCAEKGRSGQCYILSGHYATVRQLMDEVCALVGRRAPRGAVSLGLARWIAPAAEWFAGITGNHRPVFTPYSVATLQTNAHFSHAKATAEFAYSPRPLTDTLRDTLAEAAQQ